MSNEVAKEGFLFVCHACGKTSKDMYGELAISYGWDESCMLNCGKYSLSLLVYDADGGRVIEIKEMPE